MNKLFFVVLVLSLLGCKEENYYPKPMGDYRIYFPEKIEKKIYEGPCNYTYKYPSFALVEDKVNCNQNIYFPYYNAVLHITSLKFDESVGNDLFFNSEYSRKLAYEHRVKADAINESVYTNDSAKVYGVSYEIIGNVASNYQFFLTDSTTHFYRGSLYFNVRPNIDSVRPVLNFLKQNINEMIKSFDWK